MKLPFTHISEFAKKPAIRIAGETVTYGTLDAESRLLARHLHAAGLAQRDVIAILAPNVPGFFTAAWAAQRSGLYYTPVGKHLKADEIAYQLTDSGAKAAFVDASMAEVTREALDQIPEAERPRVYGFQDIEGFIPLAEAMASGREAPEIADIEGGDLLYTSGTTGRPKGVKRQLPLDPLGSDMRRVERMTELFSMSEDTVFYTAAPIYHAAPLRFAMTVLKMGATLVLDKKFDPVSALETLTRENVTHSQWVPTMFVRMLDLPPEERARFYQATAHVKAIHSGAPCPRPVKQAMIEWWGQILHEYYSGTESVGFTHIDSPDWLRFPGSVGKPWGCKIHILDDEMNELPIGAVGNVYFEGRSGLKYHNADDKTAEAHSPQGWATMGDIGYVNDEGFLFLSDRKKFVIISGGVNIYPYEIESVLDTHPSVREAAVFGIPDSEFGEAVQAVVQLHAGTAPTPDLAQELHRYVRARIAGFKAPKWIDFADDLPRLPNGKLEKHRLKDAYRDRAERGFAQQKHATA